MQKEKETVFADYQEMIEKSWTWAKLTEDEKEAYLDVIETAIRNHEITGTYEKRWRALNMVYMAFLAGCGNRHGKFREEA